MLVRTNATSDNLNSQSVTVRANNEEIKIFVKLLLAKVCNICISVSLGMVTRDIYDESDKKKGDQRKPIGSEEVWDSIKLAELLISLPKPEPEAPKPLKKAKVHLIPEGKTILIRSSGNLNSYALSHSRFQLWIF